jgi:hypothetical protein
MTRAFTIAQEKRADSEAKHLGVEIRAAIRDGNSPFRVLGNEMDGWSNHAEPLYPPEEERRIEQAARLIERKLGLYILEQSRKKR